ncbi:unnamed protein product [Candida verbasci]|uniref:Uncharacterized protein n=1 Tax=Candida verbasci TaxID=1227364 RepID=A0A9W4TT67_9ASCO|nr:unnamed protein product [Candida verbasci]
MIIRNLTRIKNNVIGNGNRQFLRFAGHSKWQNIRHDKAKNDLKKSKEATLLATKIESCVRGGGKEVKFNATLEQLLEKAKRLNITKQVIDKAIKRGAGEIESDTKQVETQYEFIGPDGVALILTALTDNKARTVAKVKTALTQFQANLSPCSYMFEKKGEIILYAKQDEKFDDVFDVVLELGAEDVEEIEFNDQHQQDKLHKLYRIICEPNEIHSLSNELTAKGYKLFDSSVRYISNPDSQVDFPEENSKGYFKAINEIDSIVEITDIFTNIKDEQISRIEDSFNSA